MFAFTPMYLPRLGIAEADVPAWTRAIVALSSFLGLPFLPFWGALADRYTRQPLIVRTFVVHLLSGHPRAAGRQYLGLCARPGADEPALGNTGLMMTTLAERVPHGRLGFAFAIMNGTPPLGAFLGPLVGGPVVDAWGFRALLAGDSVLMPPSSSPSRSAIAIRSSRRNDARSWVWPSSRCAIVGSPRLRTLFPALFLLFGGWMLAFTYVPLAIRALYTGSEPGKAVGVVLGLGGLTTIVFSPTLGALADRFGYWSVLFAGALVETALWPLPALAHGLAGSRWPGRSSMALLRVFAVSFSVLSESADSSIRGRIMTFAYLPVNVGFIVGPAIGSIITQHNIFAVFPVAACFTALGIGTLALAAQKQVTAVVAPSLT